MKLMFDELKKKILFVDDEEDLFTIFKDQLEQGPFQCYYACDAIDGLNKTRELMPDLVLLDLMMPKMSGLGYLRARNEDENLKKVPVIVMTALRDEAVYQEAKRLGAIDYLVKTCDDEEIKVLLQRHLFLEKTTSNLTF